MCNLYNVTTAHEAVDALFRLSRAGPNLPASLDLYPRSRGPVVMSGSEGRELAMMTWGVPLPAGKPVTNVRNLASPFWRSMLKDPARRCLVPVTRFCEYHPSALNEKGHKAKVWFDLVDQPLFASRESGVLLRATPSTTLS